MRRIRALSVALLAVAALVPAGVLAVPASADTTFTFYGAGWGHGVGMSQYGAYGLATDGWNDQQILASYYPGTTLQQVAAPDTIRVGLLQAQKRVQLQALDGAITLRLSDPSSGADITVMPRGATWTIGFHSDGKYWIRRANGTYVGNKGYGGSPNTLYALFAKTHAIVNVPGTGHKYDHGQLEFNITGCGTGCYRGRLILDIHTDDYVEGIAEVPASWPMAALEAQAVAARTYGLYKADHVTYPNACNCDVYAGTNDQTFIGHDRVAGPDGSRWVAASEATAGEALTFGSDPIPAFYSSSNGGYEQSDPHGIGGAQLPYLPDRCDPGDYNSANPNNTWTTQMHGSTIGAKVGVGTATGFTNVVRFGSGRISSITVVGTSGSVTISGLQFRNELGLNSSLVWINRDFLITGAIRTLYDSLPCPSGDPAAGLPINVPVSSSEGRRQQFANGVIYADHVYARTVYLEDGDIMDEYQSLGGVNSVLGWPATGVIVFDFGTRSVFVGGYIYDSDATGAHETHGIVQQAYFADGGGHGPLGLPTTDVQLSGSTRSQDFEHGSITCDVGTGACQVTQS